MCLMIPLKLSLLLTPLIVPNLCAQWHSDGVSQRREGVPPHLNSHQLPVLVGSQHSFGIEQALKSMENP